MFDLDAEGIVRRVRAAFPELALTTPITETSDGSG
jgi:hypothetical protein